MDKRTLGLAGKHILVTGAHGYLGSYICSALDEEIAVPYLIDKVGSEAREIDQVDITSSDSIEKYTNDLKEFFDVGKDVKFSGIINNAALNIKGVDLTPEQFTKTLEANVTGAFNIINAFKPFLTDDASIVNVSSIYGMLSPNFDIYGGEPEQYSSSAYGASKAAIAQMTRYYAVQLAPLRVNSVSPGGIFQNQQKKFVKLYSDRAPLKRMADPEEIVNAILFLLSPLSSYITGHNLVVDGGLSIW